MQINYSGKFRKQFKKAPEQIKSAFEERLKLFQKDKQHSSLRNHPLTGVYKGFRSINITGDWRAIFVEHIYDDKDLLIEFELLGTHSELYG